MYCHNCREERDIEIREEKESYPVRNEQTEIMAKVTYCMHCGEQIWNEEFDENNLQVAYRIYRAKHGLLQPEEIKRIREKYTLSQTAFGRILGFGDKTITRYENGSIQDLAQNNLIELASFPDVFELLLNKNAEYISQQDYDRAIKMLMQYKPRLICGDNPISYRTDQTKYQYSSGNKYFGGLQNVG
jgi:putative zinc finger/helix-turn-helix YgiT family protein